MAVELEAPQRPANKVDQDKLLALLREYSERVRTMTERLEEIQFRRLLASAGMILAGMIGMLASIGYAVPRTTLAGPAGLEFTAGIWGICGVALVALFFVWRSTAPLYRPARRSLEVYSHQLHRISQRVSELKDYPAAFEQFDAHLELELAMLDAESAIRFAETAMRR